MTVDPTPLPVTACHASPIPPYPPFALRNERPLNLLKDILRMTGIIRKARRKDLTSLKSRLIIWPGKFNKCLLQGDAGLVKLS